MESLNDRDRYLSEQTLRSVVVGTASTGGQFFRSLVEHVASALGARYAWVTRCDGSGNARSLALWIGDSLAENIEYNVVGHPCERVMQGETLHIEKGIQAEFPDDPVELSGYDVGLTRAERQQIRILHVQMHP